MTKLCEECKKPFRGSQQRRFCCTECAEIYVLKKRKEAKEKGHKPWEQGDPTDDSDEYPTPFPPNSPDQG